MEKALLFPNWSSFSCQLLSAYVSNFSQIFSQPWGGGGGEGSVHCRPGWYGKERRVGPQGGYPGPTGIAGSSEDAPQKAGTARKAGRASTGRSQVQVGMVGGGVCTYIVTITTNN